MNGLSYILRSFDTLVPGQLQRAFTGVPLDNIVDSTHGVWEVTVVSNDNRGTGKVSVKSNEQEFTVLFKPGQDYPDVMDGAGSAIKVDAIVSNGRIQASTIKQDDKHIDTLPPPRLYTGELSKQEVEAIKKELDNYNIIYDKGYKYLELLVMKTPDDLSIFNKYASRIYYQTDQEDTQITRTKNIDEVRQRKLDREVEDQMPLGSVNAVRIMSETPVYINKTLLDSLPKIIDDYSLDTTHEVLNSIDGDAFKRIRNAYKNEGLKEILYDDSIEYGVRINTILNNLGSSEE